MPSLRAAYFLGNCLSCLIPQPIARIFRRPNNSEGPIRLPSDEESQSHVPTTKRRALLIGIAYSSPSNTWSRLEGPHDDVDRYLELLTGA
jgi:hypothetical protein